MCTARGWACRTKVLDHACAQVTQKDGFSGVHGTGLGVLEGCMGAGVPKVSRAAGHYARRSRRRVPWRARQGLGRSNLKCWTIFYAQVTQKDGFSGVHGTGLGVLEGFMGAGVAEGSDEHTWTTLCPAGTRVDGYQVLQGPLLYQIRPRCSCYNCGARAPHAWGTSCSWDPAAVTIGQPSMPWHPACAARLGLGCSWDAAAVTVGEPSLPWHLAHAEGDRSVAPVPCMASMAATSHGAPHDDRLVFATSADES